ncbi:MAG: efflux RND transporter periplasmic adaptor subunit [Hyphomonadaceae bacterium]|nr:efflux RND transporter periplasmic adaptor subunit [Hyphomonadaceae bacterium]
MTDLFKRFGFATVVLALVALMALAVVGKSLLGPDKGGQQASAAGPPKAGKKGGGGPGGPDAPAVIVGAVSSREFYDVVQAIGTAQARESITVSAKVTDVIRAIRFESGDRVARGQVLVELSSIEQSADLEEARATREAAKRDYDRFRELGEKGFAPAQRVEAARAAFEQADARVRAGMSRIGDRTIRAPFAGVMGLRSASPGALVRPGDVIGTLDDVSSIKLDFDVAESQIDQARVGADVVARTAAAPGRTFTGRVADVDTRVNTQSRTLRVRAIIPNADGALKPGMLMSVELRSNPRVGLGAPEIAVLERSDGSYVFAVEAQDGRDIVKPILVRTGQRSDGMVELVSGAEAGMRIIVEGVQRARPNQPVRVMEAPPATPASAPTPAPSPPPVAVAPPASQGVAKQAPGARETSLRGRAAPAGVPATAEQPLAGSGGQSPSNPAD